VPAVDAVNHILCLLAGLGEPGRHALRCFTSTTGTLHSTLFTSHNYITVIQYLTISIPSHCCIIAVYANSGSGCRRSLDAGSNLKGAIEIYADARQLGIDIHEPSYSALIRCTTAIGSIASNASNATTSANITTATSANITTATTTTIRCHAANDLPMEALGLFRQLETRGLSPKHRTFSPLLAALCRGGHVALSFELFHSMADKYALIPLEKDYTSMLQLCLGEKDERFTAVLDNMMEDVLVPTAPETITVLREWFLAQHYPNSQTSVYSIYEAVPSAKGEFSVADLGIDASADSHSGSNSNSNSATANSICITATANGTTTDSSGYALRSVDLAACHRDNLVEQINTAAVDRSETRRRPVFNQTATNSSSATATATAAAAAVTDATTTAAITASVSAAAAANETASTTTTVTSVATTYKPSKMVINVKFNFCSWDAFLDWIRLLDNRIAHAGVGTRAVDSALPAVSAAVADSAAPPIFRSKGPYDVMVDGANVGYFKQNYAGAPSHIDYFQVLQCLMLVNYCFC
jgi:hypothetical protein